MRLSWVDWTSSVFGPLILDLVVQFIQLMQLTKLIQLIQLNNLF